MADSALGQVVVQLRGCQGDGHDERQVEQEFQRRRRPVPFLRLTAEPFGGARGQVPGSP